MRLRSLLAARGIPVVTTRESDATVDPDRRAEIANHANAQACLSLHASESGSGVHLFISSLAPAQPARFARLEDRAGRLGTAQPGSGRRAELRPLHAGMTVTLGRTALPAIDSMTCPAVAVEIAPERGAGQASRQPAAWTIPATRRAWPRRWPPRCWSGARCRRMRRPASRDSPLPDRPLRRSARGFGHHGRGAVAFARARPPAAARRRRLGAHAGPEVAPAEQATLMVANDADNSLLTQILSLPLPQNPDARARAVLGKLLDLYAAPDAAHPVPGGASSIAQVFLLPAQSRGAASAAAATRKTDPQTGPNSPSST